MSNLRPPDCDEGKSSKRFALPQTAGSAIAGSDPQGVETRFEWLAFERVEG
jgi:hypothetical protein